MGEVPREDRNTQHHLLKAFPPISPITNAASRPGLGWPLSPIDPRLFSLLSSKENTGGALAGVMAHVRKPHQEQMSLM